MTKEHSRTRAQARKLAFGFSTIFLSSFGQTFFISLFLVSIVTAMGMSQGDFGRLYSAATLMAGLTLPRFGRWLDTRTERFAFLVVGAGMAVSLVALSAAWTWWVLFSALLGLRAFGQGAMALLSTTAMARYFERRRGLALGISGLGFSCAEMILPALTLAAIGMFGWRQSMLLYAGLVVLAVVLIRLTVLIRPLEGEESSRQVTKRDPQVATAIQGHVFRWWKDPFFLLVTASSLIMPFGGTVVILYLVPISRAKGWPVDWVAAGFMVFAVVRASVSLLVGPLIDSFGGLRLFPWSLAPFSLAIALLLMATSPWLGLGFFVFLGLGFGAGLVLTALLAEVYGSHRIGEVRSLSASAAILSTALGPFSAGFAIDRGWSFDSVLAGLLVASLTCLAGAVAAPFLAPSSARKP